MTSFNYCFLRESQSPISVFAYLSKLEFISVSVRHCFRPRNHLRSGFRDQGKKV